MSSKKKQDGSSTSDVGKQKKGKGEKRPGVYYAILHDDLGSIAVATLVGSTVKDAEAEAIKVAVAANIVRVDICRVAGVFQLTTSLKRVPKKPAVAKVPPAG